MAVITGIKGRLKLEKGAPTNFSKSEKAKGVTVSLSGHGADPASEEEAGGLSGREGSQDAASFPGKFQP